MWPFKKQISLEGSGVFEGFTDWHSHILPGVDDGVQTMEEAIKILRAYERLGVSTVWLTPHVMEDIPNTTAHLRERYAELRAAYNGPINLHLAAENMLDNLFEERLAKNDLLPLGEQGDHLLVETSYFNPPMDLYGMLERIRAKGYYPVLAHPERYVYMDSADYRRLRSAGVRMQLNLPAMAGAYGQQVRAKATGLLGEDFYCICGSDIHSFSIWCRIIREKNLQKKAVHKLQRLVEHQI